MNLISLTCRSCPAEFFVPLDQWIYVAEAHAPGFVLRGPARPTPLRDNAMPSCPHCGDLVSADGVKGIVRLGAPPPSSVDDLVELARDAIRTLLEMDGPCPWCLAEQDDHAADCQLDLWWRRYGVPR